MFPEQRRVAVGTLRGDERVRRIDLRWGLYAYLLQDRTELVPELTCGRRVWHSGARCRPRLPARCPMPDEA